MGVVFVWRASTTAPLKTVFSDPLLLNTLIRHGCQRLAKWESYVDTIYYTSLMFRMILKACCVSYQCHLPIIQTHAIKEDAWALVEPRHFAAVGKRLAAFQEGVYLAAVPSNKNL